MAEPFVEKITLAGCSAQGLTSCSHNVGKGILLSGGLVGEENELSGSFTVLA